MRARLLIKRFQLAVLLAAALVLGIYSVLIPSFEPSSFAVSREVSNTLERRFHKLEQYANTLLYLPESRADWPDLDGFPDDMVIYKYVDDTLHSWYNRFSVYEDDITSGQLYARVVGSVASPLIEVSADPLCFKFGDKWYVARLLEKENVKLIEGLLIKDSRGINKALGLQGGFDLSTVADNGGLPVMMDDRVIFKLEQQPNSPSQPIRAYTARWMAIILLLAAVVTYVADRRSYRSCIFGLLSLVVLTIISRAWEATMGGVDRIFSPDLYSGGAVLDSLATILIFNTAITLCAIFLFLCRDAFFKRMQGRKTALWIYLGCMAVAAVLTIVYTIYTLSDLLCNSSITMDLFLLPSLSLYTLILYVSYSFLCIAALLLLELVVGAFCMVTLRRTYTLLNRGWILAWSVLFAVIISNRVITNNLNREDARAGIWCEMIALDRSVDLEMQLLTIEPELASDPVMPAIMDVANSAAMVSRRLEDVYFPQLSREYSVRATLFDSDFKPSVYLRTLNDASPLSDGSRFMYENNPLVGNKYLGIFRYHCESGKTAYLMVEISPRPESAALNEFPNSFLSSSSMSMPPFYSYAKYYDRKLCSFRGSYAYPTVLDSTFAFMQDADRVEYDGYIHFVYSPDAREIVVVSRPRRSVMSLVVLLSLLVLMIYVCGIIFRPRSGRRWLTSYSTRIRYIVIGSLSLTLVVMTGVSVWFVYNRNERNLQKIMSSRISAVQIMLDDMCKTMDSAEDFMRPELASGLNEIARTINTDISIYTPDGRLFASTDRKLRNFSPDNSRLDAEAFKSIVLRHQRYYIHKDSRRYRPVHEMYCQLSNAQGNIVAIASMPYMERDYDFSRDALFHAVIMLSLFLLLMFVTVFLATSITQKIFSPLLEMSRKMHGGKADELEKISYSGKDEISAIVAAYNGMVEDLQASTEQLAVAERDKAWSEMARQVAHEIKNPLTPIKLEIQRLMRLKQRNDPSWEERFDDMAQVVLEHIDILSQTANEFSTFAKLYSEQAVLIDLDKTLRDQTMLFAKNVEMTYLGAPDAVIYGPKPQLIRVFVNLLSNAVQAVEGAGLDKPQVLVSLRKSSAMDGWDITIEDNGPGVNEQNQAFLFTPNFTTKSSGTGLGLAICKSIVDRCGGSISYSRSFSLGGACFTVSLPCSTPEETLDK